MSDNCRKFCFELLIWFTDRNYRCERRLIVAVLETGDRKVYAVDGFPTAETRKGIAGFKRRKN